jgi:hypothetical protein
MQPEYRKYHEFIPRDPELDTMKRRIINQVRNQTRTKRPQSFGYPSSNQQPPFDYRSDQRPDWINPFGWKTEENVGKRQRQESDPEQEKLREERLRQERLRREQERQEQERREQERQEQERREQERREQISRNSEMSINDADRELLQKILSYFRTNSQNPQLTQLSIEELKSLIYNNKYELDRRIQADKPIVKRFNLILHPDKLNTNGLSDEFYSKIDEFYRIFGKIGGKKRTYRNKSNKKKKNTRSKKHLKKNKRKV